MDEAEIFAAALERSPEERGAWLDRACGADAALRERLTRLLAVHERTGGFLRQPAPVAPPSSPAAPGDRIGPYRLEEEIGSGGFGVVFAAEQTAPVRRRVALKVIKAGMDTREVVTRFEAERQALALMDHPHIARVFDGGTTPGGRPFFVMELVPGVPIQEYCDQVRLSLRMRLKLFVQVCRAVQHAHQKGVIHRDIKPSNVLVTMHDGRAAPKVIDFGVAKATGQRLTEETFRTRFAQMIGTPQYMSPEQAEMSALDVDTRSDIYSLGVLLYELLTGSTPLERERLKTATFDELRRMIRHEDPPTPSARLTSLNGAAAKVAAARRMEPRRLVRRVRGELDWIVMKAIEKDPARRYASAADLAADVERYLGDEPVEAGPPSRLYRMRKFGRRHRTGLGIAALLLAVLGVLGWNLRERLQRDARLGRDVESALDEAARIREHAWSFTGDPPAWEAQHAAARSALERAQSLLGAASGGGRADLQALVRDAREALATDESDRRMVATLDRLATEHAFGYQRTWDEDERQRSVAYREVFRGYGVIPGSEPAEDCGARVAGKRAPVRDAVIRGLDGWMTAALNSKQAEELWIARALARADPDPWRREVRAARRALDTERLEALARDPRPRDPADLHGLAATLYRAGKQELAIDLTMAEQERRPGSYLVNGGLGTMLFHAGRYEEAKTYLRIAISLRPEKGLGYASLSAAQMGLREWEGARRSALRSIELGPESAESHDNLGSALSGLERYEEAVSEHRKAIDLAPRLWDAHFNLGRALRKLGRGEAAIAALLEAAALAPEAIEPPIELASAYAEGGQLAEAERFLRKGLALDAERGAVHSELAAVLLKQGRPDEAEVECRRAIQLDPGIPEAHGNLAQILAMRADLDGALREAKQAVSIGERRASVWGVLGETHLLRNEPDQAAIALQKAIDLDPNAVAYSNLCAAEFMRGDLRAAVAAARAAVRLEANSATLFNLALVLRSLGELDEAIPLYERAAAAKPDHSQANADLGTILLERGDPERAMHFLERALEINPREANANNTLGHMAFARGDAEEALRRFNAAIEGNPRNAQAHHNKGAVLSQMGKLEAARSAIEEALRLDPAYANAYCSLASVLLGLGELERALETTRKALALRTDFDLGHLVLGMILHARGDLEQARRHWDRALELRPQAPPAWRQEIAWALATHADPKLRDPAAAVRYARAAVEQASEQATMHTTLGVAQYRTGDFAAAVQELEKSIALQGDESSPVPQLFLAMAKRKLGREEARRLYERAVTRIPEHAEEETQRFRKEADALFRQDDD